MIILKYRQSSEIDSELLHDDVILSAVDTLNRNKSCGIFSPDSTGKLIWVINYLFG